ncbi:hypothetical protein H6G82_02815 [Planktothricoides sp. FACHB-1261]|nr:hypothetical protein [Planktothricoides raciborskii FACHB-1261]
MPCPDFSWHKRSPLLSWCQYNSHWLFLRGDRLSYHPIPHPAFFVSWWRVESKCKMLYNKITSIEKI